MKDKFLAELRAALNDVNYNEIDETIAYFDEMITDKVEEGYDEAEVIDNLGSSQDIANILVKEEEKKTPFEAKEAKQAFPEPEEVLVDEDEDKKRLSFDPSQFSKIMFESIAYDLTVSGYDGSEVILEYDRTNESSFSAKISHDCLEIENELSGFNRFFHHHKERKEATLYLPNSWDGVLDSELVSGNFTLQDKKLVKLIVESAAGNVMINNLKTDKVDIEAAAGNILIDDLKAQKLKIEAAAGNVAAKRIEADFINIEMAAGNGEISIIGKEEDYWIKIEKIFNTIEHHPENKDVKYLKAELVAGKFHYSFID